MHFHFSNLRYSYSENTSFELGPLTLHIDSLKITALIGSNGSGKTTFIKVMLNELINFTGDYLIDQTPMRDKSGSLLHQYNIGYAPEQPVLEERLSGLETMHLLKEIHTIPDKQFDREIKEYSEILNLEEWFDTLPCRDYSQGMRKKTSLMIALIGTPEVIIIDEPTNGLDPIAVFGLKKIIANRKRTGLGTLVSSHMLDFVERVADEIIIIKNGSILYTGSVDHLFVMNPNKNLDEIYYYLFTGKTTDSPA